MPDRFDDLPVLAALGTSLRTAMAQAQAEAEAIPAAAPRRDQHERRWRRQFPALSTVLVLGLVGTAAAAATLTVLRGSPIPAPRAADLGPAMTAKVGTQQVLGLRAADPKAAARPPFALRTGTSEGGLTCVTVGQLVDGTFGIVGTDGVHRELSPTLVDGCGKATDRDAAVAGARVLEAEDYSDVRTVVYGVGGPAVISATLTARGQTRDLEVKDGAFLTALTGYPEDNGLRLRLGLAGGATVTHELGIGPLTILDPSGPAWIAESGSGVGMRHGPEHSCVTLRRARQEIGAPYGPPVCDLMRGKRDGRPKSPWFFDIRTLRPGDHGGDPQSATAWSWKDGPARTVVWGHAEPKDVADITVTGPNGLLEQTKPKLNGAFAIVLDGSVKATRLRTAIRLKNGRIYRFSGPVLPIGRID